MATRIQNTSAATAGAQTSLSKALATAIAIGDLIVVGCLYGDDATTASINDATLGAGKDSLGNSYSILGPLDYTGDGDFLYVFYSVATVAGSATIRVLASSGSHVIKACYSTVRPTNTFTLDQAVTSHYNSTAGSSLTSGSQTPTSAAGYAFNVFAGIGAISASGSEIFTAGSGFTFLVDSPDGWVAVQDTIYSSTALLTGSATTSNSVENGGILALFKDGSGGGGGRLFRGAVDLDGLGGMGTKRFNPSL